MKSWTIGPILIAGLLALCVATGCNKSDEKKVVKVSGTVTRNGQAVPNLTLHFVPLKGRPSWGKTDESGKYTLSYDPQRNGAEVGKHRVYVEFRVNSPEEEHQRSLGKWKLPPDRKAILEKYGNQDKPALEIEVKDDGQPIDIKLD